MNFTEIENHLIKKERTVTGIKFEKSDKSLINENRVNMPESDNWLNLTAITWGFGRDMVFSLTSIDGHFVLFVGLFNAFFGGEETCNRYHFDSLEDAINIVTQTLINNAPDEQLEQWLEFEN